MSPAPADLRPFMHDATAQLVPHPRRKGRSVYVCFFCGVRVSLVAGTWRHR